MTGVGGGVRRGMPKWLRVLIGTTCTGGLLLVVFVTCVVRHSIVVGIGEEVRFDDDAYVVRNVERVRVIGDGENAVHAGGEFVIVTIRYTNRARRVERTIGGPRRFLLCAEDGRTFAYASAAQAVLDTIDAQASAWTAVLRSGETREVRVAFDIPNGEHPLLRFSYGGKTIDRWDDLIWGTRRARLER